ncbi:lipoprotein 17-related variable surface protein [Mycoplasmopsis agassizii]|uniref:Lipoprotein-associated type-17 domain-containing protein n=1 Tax=Mycoplasmopsis agassizii TaxID=33922 RepID=A0ABX4H5N1_9BACT|nr:lipoprotein 17-related variable surface protein [Mycoplasmopsis agassizii]PAF55186.1 hypothetical protein CJF60_00670 [Mycoplasmopsis agassizii]SMC19850.1 Lipoprotein associated domain-containing protein [Mycoplasmopsis agassizii]
MKKLNKKSILLMTSLVAGTIAVSAAIACSPATPLPDKQIADQKVVDRIADSVKNGTYNAKNTYANIEALNKATANVKSVADLEKILDAASVKTFKSALGKATFASNSGSLVDANKKRVNLKIKISYEQPAVFQTVELKINYVAPGTAPEVKTDNQLAKEWYDSVALTNNAADNIKDKLPSAVTTFNAQNLQTALATAPTGFSSHVKLVASSADDATGSLKVSVSLSKGNTWFSSDGTTAANEAAVVAKIVTVSGFKNTAQTNAQKAVVYYSALPTTKALTEQIVTQTLPSAVTQEILNSLVGLAPDAPEGLTVSLSLVDKGANDKDGKLSVKVTLSEAADKFFNTEGGIVNTLANAGKVIEFSGFKIQDSKTPPVVVEPTKPADLVKAWFETITETKKVENHKSTLPSSLTQANLETTLGTLYTAPTNVKDAKIVLTLVSTDNDAGIATIKVALKSGNQWYSPLNGALENSEITKQVVLTDLQTTAEAVKEIYKNQSATITVDSTKTASETAKNLEENVKSFFSVLQTSVSKIKLLNLTLRVATSSNAIDDETGKLMVNFYLSRDQKGKTQYFKQDGSTTEVLTQVDGKDVTLTGFKQVHQLDQLSDELMHWKVKDDIIYSEVKEFVELTSDTEQTSDKVFELLKKFASLESSIKTSTEGMEIVNPKKLLTWSINDYSAMLVFKLTLRRKADPDITKTVTFQSDFRGFLPAFLNIKGSVNENQTNKFITLTFNELSEGNTFNKWSSFVRRFALDARNDDRKLMNFANSLAEKIKANIRRPINEYNLIYPFSPADMKTALHSHGVLNTALSGGDYWLTWMGANSQTYVIGGLQNATPTPSNIKVKVGNGKPWKVSLTDGTNSSTYIEYNSSLFGINSAKRFSITQIGDWRDGKGANYKKGFALDNAATLYFPNDSVKSPFTNGIAAGTMLLLKAIINNQ